MSAARPHSRQFATTILFAWAAIVGGASAPGCSTGMQPAPDVTDTASQPTDARDAVSIVGLDSSDAAPDTHAADTYITDALDAANDVRDVAGDAPMDAHIDVFHDAFTDVRDVASMDVHIDAPADTHDTGAVDAPVDSAPLPAIYWGAYIPSVPWSASALSAFESLTQKPLSIIHWGEPWIHGGTMQPFYPGDFDTVRNHGAIPLIDWASWDYSNGPTQPAFALSQITSGTYDSYIATWAQAAHAWGHPLFIRFDWEMNGWWQFPWSEQLNGNQPGDYVRAWRHVHDIFVAQGATNVSWVWCPNIISTNTTPLAELYPGDGYVDWIAMDGYNWGTDNGGHWQTFDTVFSATYAALVALAPSKPIMIAETASSENGGSKAAWIMDVLGTQLPVNYPSVRAFVWFDWNAGDPSLSWPIDSSTTSVAAFAAGIASSYYAPNDFSTLDTSPIPPPTR